MSGKPIDAKAWESVARAICVACEENPDGRGDAQGNGRRWHDYLDVAQAAISALIVAQQQGQAVAWADEWRAAVAAKLSSYGLSEEAAAVFASSELDEYKAGLCDCAENDPADMVDLMMGVALDATEKWKAESAGRPFGYKRTAPPPSVPVGVEVASLPALWRQREDNGEEHTEYDKGFETASDECARMLEAALAQQPAAVPNIGVGVDIVADRVHVTVVHREGHLDTVIYSEMHQLQPAADAEWIKHPQTIEAKAQWDAVAHALGADGDDPDAVLAAAQRARQPAAVDEVVCPNCERLTEIRHCQTCGCDFTAGQHQEPKT